MNIIILKLIIGAPILVTICCSIWLLLIDFDVMEATDKQKELMDTMMLVGLIITTIYALVDFSFR